MTAPAGGARSRWLAILALVLAVVCIGWSALFVRWAGIPGASSAFYRALIAAAVLLPVRLARRSPWPSRRTLFIAAAGGVCFALDLALFNTAVMRTSAATATLLGNNTPLVVALGGWALFGRRPASSFWAGLLLALAGSAALVLADVGAIDVRADLAGDAMAMGASVFFAAYLLVIGRVRDRMDTLTLTTVAVCASALTMLVVCLVLGMPLAGFGARTWWSLLALGLVSQLTAYLAITYALGHLPTTVTSVGLLAQAPITALLAVPLLGDRLRPLQIVGGALVLAGIYVVNRFSVGTDRSSAAPSAS